MKCPHCGKKIGPRKIGHVCTQFVEVTVDGMGPCLYRTCKTCGQDWQRGDTRYGGDGTWRKVPNDRVSGPQPAQETP